MNFIAIPISTYQDAMTYIYMAELWAGDEEIRKAELKTSETHAVASTFPLAIN